MKTTRRIITLALALILVLALAAPAFAAGENGTITVTRPVGATGTASEYTVYQIFDTNPVVGGHTYKLTAEWATFTAPGYFSVNANGYVVWEKNPTSVADAAAVAQLAKAYVAAESPTALAEKVTAGGAAISVAPGYYLLVPENGPCGVIMVEAGETATVEEKTTATGHPKVEKKVYEDSTNTYLSANTVDYGQTINFQTTITVGAGAEKYILHDKMDSHIEYTNAFTLTRDGNTLAAAGNYEIDDTPTDGCTFHVVFSDSLCADLHENAKIVVQYTGKLKPGADTNTAHENTTWLTYKNDVPSNVAVTETRTFEVSVKKVDDADPANPLAGAGFILRDNIGKYYAQDGAGNVIWVELADEAAKQAAAVVTGVDGVVKFVGVDAENFVLEEVVVPNGYTGTTNVAASTKNGDQGEGKNVEVTVVNTLGEALPETGGIGTTVFYVLGGVLLVGALVALAVIKRKETSAQ